jgi:hypothetical protein
MHHQRLNLEITTAIPDTVSIIPPTIMQHRDTVSKINNTTNRIKDTTTIPTRNNQINSSSNSSSKGNHLSNKHSQVVIQPQAGTTKLTMEAPVEVQGELGGLIGGTSKFGGVRVSL